MTAAVNGLKTNADGLTWERVTFLKNVHEDSMQFRVPRSDGRFNSNLSGAGVRLSWGSFIADRKAKLAEIQKPLSRFAWQARSRSFFHGKHASSATALLGWFGFFALAA